MKSIEDEWAEVARDIFVRAVATKLAQSTQGYLYREILLQIREASEAAATVWVNLEEGSLDEIVETEDSAQTLWGRITADLQQGLAKDELQGEEVRS